MMLTCLLLLIWRDETFATDIIRSKRQDQGRFRNFPDLSQTQFNSDRYQTSFSPISQQQLQPPQQQQQQFPPQQRQQSQQSQQRQFSQEQPRQSVPRQQQQQRRQQGSIPLPGSGRSLFDQIVNRINTGHRENARKKTKSG